MNWKYIFGIIALLNIIDYGLTVAVLDKGGVKLNPLMAKIVQSHLFTIFKLICISAFVLIIVKLLDIKIKAIKDDNEKKEQCKSGKSRFIRDFSIILCCGAE